MNMLPFLYLYVFVGSLVVHSERAMDGEREREGSRYSSTRYGNRLSNRNRSAALQTRAMQQQRTAAETNKTETEIESL